MKSILMDTSNTYLVVALYDNDTCIEYIQEKGNRKQSEYAILYLEQLLKKHKMEMLEIDQMVITIGPGSYTGVRVALTIAKTLAAVTSIKIKVVSSLNAYAGLQKAVSILDARSKKIFVGVYDEGKPIVPETMIDIADFEEWYQQYAAYPIVGDAQLVNREEESVKLYQNIYEVSKLQEAIENVDALIPRYIKEVEAKKLC